MEDDRTEDVVVALTAVGRSLGIRALDIRRAIRDSNDKEELLKRWRRAHSRATSRIERHIEESALDGYADAAHERDAERRRTLAHERQARRRAQPIGRRLDRVLSEIATSPGMSTGSYVPSGSRAPQSSAPPPADTLDVSSHLRVIEARIEAIEDEWDAFRGLGVVKNWAMASGEEKDREILSPRWRGVKSAIVSEAAPYLGSARTIERVRRAASLRPSDGTEMPHDK